MQYKIVEAESANMLTENVNKLISDGFEPIGGVSVLYWSFENDRKGDLDDGYNYTQAMIKKDDVCFMGKIKDIDKYPFKQFTEEEKARAWKKKEDAKEKAF